MDSPLHIVIIGAAATDGAPGFTPEARDVADTYMMLSAKGIRLQVHLIDPGYQKVMHSAVFTAAPMMDEFKRVISLDEAFAEVVPKMCSGWNTQANSRVINDPQIPIIIVSYLGLTSTYQVLTLLESSVTTNRWFYLPDLTQHIPRCNVNLLVHEYLGIQQGGTSKLILQPYNIFSGEVIPKGFAMPSGDLLDAKEYLTVGCSMIREYLRGKLHESTTSIPQVTLPSWVYNVETPILKGLIGYYGLIPEIKDRTPAIEIRESAAYRRQVTNMLCQVIANFAVNNGLISPPEVVNTGGWYSLNTWSTISSRIAAWSGPS